MGVNAGADTDSMATMGGAIYGAMSGSSAFDPADVELIEKSNFSDPQMSVNFDLLGMAKGLDKVIDERRN